SASRVKTRSRASWSYRIVAAGPSVTAARDRRHRLASDRTRAPAPAEARRDTSPGSGLAAARPIQRLVIQVDEPPAPRAVGASAMTHITVIAAGDPRAPGAQLTVVKSQREETLP